MTRRTPKRSLASAACVLTLGAFATLARGVPPVGNGPFNLPIGQQVVIWQPAAPVLAAVRVTTANGTVRARANDGANHNLGLVPAGRACVFEGPFSQANLIADAGYATNGAWEVRAPTDGGDADRLLGSGTLSFGPAGAAYSPYGFYTAAGAAADTHRLLVIDGSANADPVTVSATNAAGGAAGPAYIIDGGDWGFCSRGISKFTVSGKNAVPFAVFNPTAAGSPATGVTRAQTAGDTDSISVDGQRNLEITLMNNGVGEITLRYALQGGADQEVKVAAGTPAPPVVGAVSKYEWVFTAQGCTATVSVKGAP